MYGDDAGASREEGVQQRLLASDARGGGLVQDDPSRGTCDWVDEDAGGSSGTGGSGTGVSGAVATLPPSRTAPGAWWVLGVYSGFAAMQGLTWSVPGVLSDTYAAVYGMGGDEVQQLINYGQWIFLVIAAPAAWVLDRYGARPSVLASAALVFAANAARCFANDASPASRALVHASFIANAFAGPCAMAGPSKVAELWFPPRTRSTATAVSVTLGDNGGALLFLLAAAAFPAPTARDNWRTNAVLAALSAANLAAALAYFPAAPRAAPSASAEALARFLAEEDAFSRAAGMRARAGSEEEGGAA